ncbi:Na+/H+ antiporter NhaC family protein [Zooshikella sp. RANM57]|uniref:Na+/H+ antiporter NhaC family protein n=1 Tax=Zooshikella sp. RANM57 TaxID=3425863 RepID=UPI003D6EA213
MKTVQGSPIALLPLLVFLVIFLGSGIYYSQQNIDFAFYQIKAPVAVLPAIIIAMMMGRETLNQKVETFLRGIGDMNIVMMCMVFLLAGAFASVTKAIGGVDATVNLGLHIIPQQLILPGIFVISAFIATAMGTSMGTIAAMAPIAVGFANTADVSLGLAVGAVIGGAMFGDNLSIISDTTIAATRTQGCEMRDKFKLNFLIATPAAVLTMVVLFVLGDTGSMPQPEEFNFLLVLPYLAVLGLALAGVNVLVVLMSGIIIAGVTGLYHSPDYTIETLSTNIFDGYSNMLEIMVLSMFIGGLSAIMKARGGLTFLVSLIQRLTERRGLQLRGGEAGISALVSIAGFFTANNTVAILISGSSAQEIATKSGIDGRRSASLLDIFSCVVQGLLPYGAQILLAGSVASMSPLDLVGNVHYCWLLGLSAIIAIIFGYPKSDAITEKEPAAC